MIEEWSSTLWQRDLSSDTCYKAAWLTKNVLENYENVDMLGYWLLTDFIDEWLVPGGVFHGGYGLFTANGIPKAGYQALRLLNRVGSKSSPRERDGTFRVPGTRSDIPVSLLSL